MAQEAVLARNTPKRAIRAIYGVFEEIAEEENALGIGLRVLCAAA